MQRYKITLEYDGSAFHGWQEQACGLVTVQSCLQDAIYKALGGEYSAIFRIGQGQNSELCNAAPSNAEDVVMPIDEAEHSPNINAQSGDVGKSILVLGAGRTDTGVHASGQVAHFDLPLPHATPLTPPRLQASINHFLQPHPVVITQIEEVPPEFHARFSALQRRYVYRILNRSAAPIIERGRVWHVREKLDHLLMHEAAQILVGRHDFSSFCATHCQSHSKVKSLSKISVVRDGDILSIHLAAPSFLHNQVRIIVGTLRLVGSGKLDKAGFQEILARRTRQAAGLTAPPEGLCLVGVDYAP